MGHDISQANIRLRDAIRQIHESTQNHPVADLLMSGDLPKNVYADLVYNYLRAYKALETEADKVGLFEGIEGIKRADLMQQELDSLTEEGITYEPQESTVAYEEYVKNIEDKDQLMAHIYIRYLSLMSGGQLMRDVVPSQGIMFRFKHIDDLREGLRKKLHEGLIEEAKKSFQQVHQLFVELGEKYNVH
jgi:heme oxygenase